jgi:hypothetical protein
MKIYEQRTFVNEDKGLMIYSNQAMEVTSGMADLILPEVGYFALVNQLLKTPNGPRQDQFRVDIPAKSIEEAFGLLPGLIPDAQKRRIAELAAHAAAQSKQLVLANGQTLPPNGNAMTRFR